MHLDGQELHVVRGIGAAPREGNDVIHATDIAMASIFAFIRVSRVVPEGGLHGRPRFTTREYAKGCAGVFHACRPKILNSSRTSAVTSASEPA